MSRFGLEGKESTAMKFLSWNTWMLLSSTTLYSRRIGRLSGCVPVSMLKKYAPPAPAGEAITNRPLALVLLSNVTQLK